MKANLFFVLAAVVFSSSAKASTPEETFLKTCLKNYVSAVSSPEKDREKMSAKARERCLSKDFLRKWDSIISVDGTGADGILLAQDNFDSWKTNIKIRNINKKEGSAEALLGSGKEEQCLFINYFKLKSDFKISSISNCAKKAN
jgi:hypothetical protein